MKYKFPAQLLVTTLALSGIMISTTEAPAHSKPQTTFSCLAYGNYWATVAQRGERRTGPMIVWESDAFGSEFTPKARCEKVSERFTTAVESNGGNMRNLLLTTGILNGQTVVCFVNTAEQCNSKNLLFSLTKENASHAGDVLAKLLRFSQRARGKPVFESGGGNEENSLIRGKEQYVSLEEVVNKAFESEGSAADSPNAAGPNPTNTVNTPDSKPSGSP